MFASGVDILGRSVERRSRERQQSSPRVANSSLGVPLRKVLNDVWKGVDRACDCEADERGGLHLVRVNSNGKERGDGMLTGKDVESGARAGPAKGLPFRTFYTQYAMHRRRATQAHPHLEPTPTSCTGRT